MSNWLDRCFAFDQFGPLSIRPCHGTCWAAHKHPDRLPATYHRTHGIRYFHGCYDLAQDRLWGITRLHKGGKYTLAALKSIRAARPDDKPIYVILDNLSANKTPAIRAWAARHNVELCLTPTNASWADPIEPQFGPLRCFVIGNSDHPNHVVLARAIQAFLRWRNTHNRDPELITAQRRERTRVRSERHQRWGRPRPPPDPAYSPGQRTSPVAVTVHTVMLRPAATTRLRPSLVKARRSIGPLCRAGGTGSFRKRAGSVASHSSTPPPRVTAIRCVSAVTAAMSISPGSSGFTGLRPCSRGAARSETSQTMAVSNIVTRRCPSAENQVGSRSE